MITQRQPRPRLYRAGAYVVYPLLAAAGGQLLSNANSPLAVFSASSLLVGALAMPALLGRYCKHCGERPLAKFMRLTVMPATIAAALAFRSSTGLSQFVAVLLLGLSAVAFALAWRTASGERDVEDERRLLGEEKPAKKEVSLVLVAALVMQSLGCGTILHPERRGQKAGRIDVGVAVLDGIGLLFFIIPGVIAFAVDFSNGAIYLPGGAHGRNEPRRIRFDPDGDEKAAVERIVRAQTGYPVKLDQDGLEAVELRSVDELPARFAAVSRRPS